MNPKLFPVILIILDLAAGVVWATAGDWRKAAYWIFAAMLTVTVTF